MALHLNPLRLALFAIVFFFALGAIKPDYLLAAEKQNAVPVHVPTPEDSRCATMPGLDPIIPLTLYQSRWVQDKSRFKIGMVSRQGGKSFSTSLEAVIDCFEHKTKWVFLSAGERQSKELMATAAMHARAIGLAVIELEGTFKEGDSEYKQLEIIFPNGSRIIGLPANPATARGHSAHILLDEFAFHKDSRAIWKALFPTVTRGYKIRIISTPMGKKNKFYELWTAKTVQMFDGLEHEFKGERGGWSKHKVDIYDAVAMGLKLVDENGEEIEPEDLRLALADDEAWHQEYLCEFLDETTAWLPYDLIEGVEDIQLDPMPLWAEELVNAAIDHHEQFKSYENPPEFTAGREILSSVLFPGDLYAGFDVARRRDLSIIWLDELIGDLARSRAVIDLKKQPFGVQRLVLFALLRLPQMRRCCIDETGIGMDLAEKAVEIFGENLVEAVTFTPKNKEALATGIRKSLEDRKDRIPADTQIRNSLHTVKKVATSTGNFRFDADREEATGHADHFWAKALAVHARSAPIEDTSILSGSPRESYKTAQGY
ncbi:terminase family protein [Geobacter pelophilus]|uniref:Terminase family protein n=1 Tax=Geoanaerobacter pelophilus TaxID=60036 RepID=A0AAW4L916_9BACT|nr:terminase family protein [Geoanaerobacter pelophilus]MBT0666345.1 terminase family protein [Geoanaerobacter pelophilus]